ncbi:hypothetical protein MBLNU13_g11579t1 [Cladosporium sp. NU13]
MASSFVPRASQTLSCPLLKLPPKLRLRIYAYTHELSVDLDINEYGYEDLSKAWGSTPLVKLAATCRLIADEARHYFRSLPTGSLQRRALVDLVPSGGPRSHVNLRLIHLPCPTIDLTHFAATYDFEKYKSTAYGFPLADQDDAAEATRSMGFYVSTTIRRLMTDTSVRNATSLKCFIIRIAGLEPRKDDERHFDAMRRVLCEPNAGPASAEKLAQDVFSWGCVDADMMRVTSTLQLPAFEGKLLCLLLV